MCRIIAIANQKGGVAKTTTTVNLGAALVEQGNTVLLIDLDPQSSLSISLGVDIFRLKETVFDALMGINQADIDSVTMKTSLHNMFIVPASMELARAELELLSEMTREYFLKNALNASKKKYDFILIDCPPSLGILTTNALAAAQEMLVPIQADYLAFRGADLLIRTTFNKVRQRLNPSLELAGILVTMFHTRTVHAREVLEEIQDTYGDRVFDTVIKYSTRMKEAPVAGASILQYQPKNPLSGEYRKLAKEITNI